MRYMRISIPLAVVGILLLAGAVPGQTVDENTARTVAENWIATVIDFEGQWGDAESAHISTVSEFKRGERVLGYYCEVEPSGHIIVSLVEGLAPVKAFSETSVLDPALDVGPADL